MPIGISDQVEYSQNEGYFTSNNTLLEEVKSNIKNWLQTNPGERIMMPGWGFGPNSFLFSLDPSNVADQMQAKIRDGFSNWFPFITINSIKSETSGRDVKVTLNLAFRSTEFTIQQILTAIR